MRPQSVAPLDGTPGVVLGVAIVRGEPVPVVDVARCLGATASTPTRFVTVRTGARTVALAVDAVVDVRPVPVHALPPLLSDAGPLAAVAARDADLLAVLETSRLVDDATWGALEGMRG
jgi:purine-binding chemotaxis protein CheW